MLSPDIMASSVRALILDVDGVLTDGALIYNPEGESKVFNVRDGHGIVMARMAGLRVAFLTGRSSEVVRRRAAELKVDAYREGVIRKGEALSGLLEELGVEEAEVCYAGDDLVDLPVLNRVGFPVTVADAVADVKKAAAWITPSGGGQGAVRELVEFILRARGEWEDIVERHVQERYV